MEALGQLCRGPGGEAIVDILASHAPTCLVHFPTLLKRKHRQTLQHELMGATGARMLREIGDALQIITAGRPLPLVLEDLGGRLESPAACNRLLRGPATAPRRSIIANLPAARPSDSGVLFLSVARFESDSLPCRPPRRGFSATRAAHA